MNNSNASNRCEYSHDHVDGKLLTTAIAIVGVIIGAVLLVIVLTCVRAYKTSLQRIYVFIILSMIIEDTLRLLGSLFNKSASHELSLACEFLGFFTLVFHWSTYIFCLVWQLHLLTIVCFQAVHKPQFVTKVSKKLKIILEVGAIAITLLGPSLVVLWTPIYEQDLEYGFTGYICTVKPAVNSSKSLETLVQLYIYTPVVLTGLVSICLLLGVLVAYCTISAKLKRAKNVIKKLSLLSLSMIGFLLTYITVSTVLKALICDHIVFYGINTTFSTVGKFVVFIAAYLIVFGCSRKKATKVHMHINKEYGSFKSSNRESPPSYTRFTIPYTGGFTDVPSRNEQHSDRV